jgi:hypothetical protein
MFDQYNQYIQQSSPIHELVKFEDSIQQLNIEQAIQVNFSDNGKNIQLTYKGKQFYSPVDRPLIHQLGGRAWQNCQKFKDISELWHAKFKQNPHQLEQELSEVFTFYNLTLRYHTDKAGLHKIYGIVTPNFVDVNQLDFREQFIEQACQNSMIIPESQGFEKGFHGEVIEYFKFDSTGFQTEFKYGLVYARNNGYEAYKVNWGRQVVICTNGLKAWRGSQLKWKHTKEVNLSAFIQQSVNDGVGNQKFLEERISASRNQALHHSDIEQLLPRLSLAKASKQRVIDRITVEAKEVGFNQWALSQSLTWLGTHEKGIQPRGRKQLTGLGTDILENSLAEVLEEESSVYYDGSYGLVLPKNFRQACAA